MREHKDGPFFVYLPHPMPHVPVYASPGFEGKSGHGIYSDAVQELDWSVGEILDALKQLGIDGNTLVVFSSDNGAINHGENHPLAGGKGTILEGGMRVPCVMRWPAGMPAGRTCGELITVMDFLPTFARLAGGKLPEKKIDGHDILPLMAGEEGAKSPYEVFYHYRIDQLRAIRSGKWKLHLALDPTLEGWDGKRRGTAGPGRGLSHSLIRGPHSSWPSPALNKTGWRRRNALLDVREASQFHPVKQRTSCHDAARCGLRARGFALAFPVCALLGVLAPMCSGESRPTLKFAGSAPATVAIEDAFKMALDNLIDINSIPYDPGKWNDTGLLETAADSRFLRAAPAYGDNPWVHDGAHNTWSAMNLLEANDGRVTRVARNTLWACCDMQDGKPVVNIQQSAHSEWFIYQLWNIAAWHYYLVTGDAGFLAKAHEAATEILAKQEKGHFNTDHGLFEGSYFVGDGISGFPEPPFDPDRHSSNALDYPETHKAMVLSTNCIYVGAYQATAAMAAELGRPAAEAAALQAKADRLAASINRHLWMPEQGRYGFFIHGTGTGKAGTLDPTQEGGGLSFAILFGVADAARTKLILANVHRQPKGITMSWPHFERFSDERPGRHNVSVWPQINGLFAQAACLGGRTDLFQSEVENLAGLFRGSGKIREIYHHLSGEHCGGFQMNRSGKLSLWQAVGNQAWGAGAFCRMVFYGLFGMDFEPGGIRFAPTLPAAWGEVSLGDLRYRDMTLTVTVKGEGNAVRGFEINGKPATEPFLSGRLHGEQHVTILLGQRPEPRTPPIRSGP